MLRILVTGKNGQVGWELQRSLAPLGEVIAFDRRGIDLRDPDAIRKVIREVNPRLIVNAAAYTAVDKAESEREAAMAINGTAPSIIAEEARRLNAFLVHYSTDYVFDGTKAGPYREEDETCPLNVYGESKLAGERGIQQAGCRYLILRTSWVYGARGTNFLLTILRLARERDELRVVDDQIGAPTWCRMIAEVTAQILVKLVRSNGEIGDAQEAGVYHLTSSGATSWFGFASEILQQSGNSRRGSAQVVPIPSGDYPTPARRPRNSRLDNTKLMNDFGLKLPEWRHCAALCLDDLKLAWNR